MKKNNGIQTTGIKSKVVLTIIWIIWVAIMYYLLLPALNIHSAGLWLFVIFICALPATILCMIHSFIMAFDKKHMSTGKGVGIGFGITSVLLLLFFVLIFFGSSMFHASSYASIMQPKEHEFTKDINQATEVSKIALMDTDSAILFGNREIGSLSDVVSQYNVSENYTQIDLAGNPVKVSALDYAGIFKYFGNKKNGVPGYVQVDPVGQDAKYVKLKKGMKYVPSAYFSEDLKRHLRFMYPTKIFDNIHFELDEDGNPYYIASVMEYKIGLFGGETVQGAIACNPVDGSCTYYSVADIPRWIDDVFDGDVLTTQFNWYGKLSNGFWNSIFGKKGCKRCTETVQKSTKSGDSDKKDEETTMSDYGYVAKDGDIWIYTGVTSVNDDASNIGFILVNERTSEAHYFPIAGADESSAMAAAQGEVQEKGYRASFPSLINVDNQPTYIMVLKDASGIVKLYAMVNVESYNKVTTSSSLDECFAKYRKLIGSKSDDTSTDQGDKTDKGSKDSDTDKDAPTVDKSFTVDRIQYVDVDGNTYVYLTGTDKNLYKMKFADDESLIYVKSGDQIDAKCIQGDGKAFTMKKITVKAVDNSNQKLENTTEVIKGTTKS